MSETGHRRPFEQHGRHQPGPLEVTDNSQRRGDEAPLVNKATTTATAAATRSPNRTPPLHVGATFSDIIVGAAASVVSTAGCADTPESPRTGSARANSDATDRDGMGVRRRAAPGGAGPRRSSTKFTGDTIIDADVVVSRPVRPAWRSRCPGRASRHGGGPRWSTRSTDVEGKRHHRLGRWACPAGSLRFWTSAFLQTVVLPSNTW